MLGFAVTAGSINLGLLALVRIFSFGSFGVCIHVTMTHRKLLFVLICFFCVGLQQKLL